MFAFFLISANTFVVVVARRPARFVRFPVDYSPIVLRAHYMFKKSENSMAIDSLLYFFWLLIVKNEPVPCSLVCHVRTNLD